MEATTRSPLQTQKIAKDLAGKLKGGEVIALYGDLGSGKTVFVQGLAQGLGIKRRILSPTFVFMRSYPLAINNKRLTFHHLDLYRGQSLTDFQVLGLSEIFSPDSIIVLEWAEKIKNQLPQNRIDVEIKRVNDTTRSINIKGPTLIDQPSTSSPSRVGPLKKAAGILKSGGVVIFPTDTVYGIGCRFDLPRAVDRVRQIKGTPPEQNFPVLVASASQVPKIAQVNPQAKELIDKYWPGPLTVVMKLRKNKEKIGFRLPNSNLTRSLIRKVGVPIIGTSANFHGQPSPKSYQELDREFIKLADYVAKGQCLGGIESTVVDTTAHPPKILRQGAITLKIQQLSLRGA